MEPIITIIIGIIMFIIGFVVTIKSPKSAAFFVMPMILWAAWFEYRLDKKCGFWGSFKEWLGRSK